LWRPTGPEELAFVEASGWREWPPRSPDQPIFYPAKTSVTCGHESAEKFTASVSHAGSVYPTGKVAVRIGGTTICTITLSRGTGRCTLANTRLRAGTYTFVALYSGDGNYNQSKSAKKVLKVAA
jgi:hypothetical protein